MYPVEQREPAMPAFLKKDKNNQTASTTRSDTSRVNAPASRRYIRHIISDPANLAKAESHPVDMNAFVCRDFLM